MSQTRWAPDLDMPTESGLHSVLLVAARYFPYMGGMETHVYEVGQRLVRTGIRVTVLTTDLSGHLPIFEDVDGVKIRRVPAWPTNKDYYFAPDMYRVIVRGGWDLVHCQGYHKRHLPCLRHGRPGFHTWLRFIVVGIRLISAKCSGGFIGWRSVRC